MKKQETESNNSIKEKLFQIGLTHYLREGAKDLSIRKITTECKVNLGSFVYHFGTKENFLRQLINQHYFIMLNRLEKYLEESSPKENPELALRELIGIMTDFVQENPQFIGRLILDILMGDKITVKIITKNPPKHLPVIINLIFDCQKKGSIRNDMTPIQTGICGMFTSSLIPVLGLIVAENIGGTIGKKLRSEILDPEFRQKRIDMFFKGIIKSS